MIIGGDIMNNSFIGNRLRIARENAGFRQIDVKEKAPIMAEALRNDVTLFNPILLNFLKSLPLQLEVEEEGVKFLLVHGSPRRNNEDILPDTPMEEVEKMLEKSMDLRIELISCGRGSGFVYCQRGSKQPSNGYDLNQTKLCCSNHHTRQASL